MGDRLTPRDLAFLQAESPRSPRHNATVEIFEPGESGFDYDALVRLISERISFVPRYRQKVLHVPVGLATPVWVDDPHLDLEYHVRRSALPRPGTMDQLRELVARIVSRPLDRTRPLWEMYFVEGLADGRIALLSKAHHALVDGNETVDLGQLLLDVGPEHRSLGEDGWDPRRPPSAAGLLLDAVKDNLTHPRTLVSTARSATAGALRSVERTGRRTRALATALTGRPPVRETPVSGRLSQQRRVVLLESELADYLRVRQAHGGTVNDVILAVVAGGLRAWLMTRAESLAGLRQIRVVVPVSVIDEEHEATSLGSQIAVHYVDLPVGEPSPVVRLHQVSYSFEKHKASGTAVAASRLAGIAGFAPTTFHAVGARVAAAADPASYQVSVTNVPGPQSARYAAGARMVASYAVHPLLPGKALAIGVTSYDGKVFLCVTADRDLVPDADVLGHCLAEALDELRDTATGVRPRAPRGRRTTPAKETDEP